MEVPTDKKAPEYYLPGKNERSLQLFREVPPVLQEALGMIVKLMAPEKIFLAGIYVNDPPDERLLHDLLIMIPGVANRPYRDYDVIIKQIGTSIYPLTATVLKRNELFKKLAAGHIYFSRVCRFENLLYDTGVYPLPVAERIPVEDIIARSEKNFSYGKYRARSFLGGAQYYFRRQENELAAFLLHQAAEQIYRGFIKSLTEHEISSHDLCSLMRRCRRYAPEFIDVFHKHDATERRLFSLLQRAYVHTRYKSNYAVSRGDLEMLINKTSRLYLIAEKVFRNRISEAAKALRQL